MPVTWPSPPLRTVLCRLCVALATAGMATAPAGHAASLQSDDLRILGKALTFLEPPLTGQPTVAIVYRDGDPASRRDAETLAEHLGNLAIGGIPLTARVVGPEALAATDFQLIITVGGADGKPVIAAAITHHALCVTADVDAVRAGDCTMAIRSAGKVEIFVSREAAARSGLGFATAFRMMVHEQ